MNRALFFSGICFLLNIHSLASVVPAIALSNTCSRPELLQAGQITDTGANLTWTDVADAYDVELRPAGQSFTGIPTHVLNSDPPFVLSDLLPGQNYRFVVRARCDNNEVSAWSNPYNFSTELNNIRPCPLLFDLRDTSCISQVQIFKIHVNDAPGSALGTDVNFTGLRLVVEHAWRSDLRIWLRSPDGALVQVIGGLNAGDRNLGNPEAGDCAPFIELTEQPGAQPLSAAAEKDNVTGLYLPFNSFAAFANGQNPNGIWQLEICDAKANDRGKLRTCALVFSQPGCDPPAGLTASNVDANSADVTWTPDATGDSILVEFGLAGFHPGSGNAPGIGGQIIKLAQLAAQPVLLNGLLPIKTYAVYIRRQCAPGFWGTNSPALEFVTNCPATLLENVNALASCPTGCADPCPLPGLWQNVGGDDYEWKVRSGPGHTHPIAGPPSASGGSGKYLFFRNSCTFNGAFGKKAALRTRCVQVFAPANASCHFSFDLYMNTKTGLMSTLELQASTDGGQTWTSLRTWSGNRGKQWRREYINLSAYHNQIALFQLVATGTYGIYGDIAIDNLAFYGSSAAGTPDFVFYRDNDGDNFGVLDQKLIACNPTVPLGYAAVAGDCDDANDAIYPGAVEILCNQQDENCNGMTDDSFIPAPMGNGDAVCEFNFGVLTATGTPSGSFYWYDAAVGGQLVGTGSTLLLPNAETSGVFYLVDSITGPSVGCSSVQIPVILTVNPRPDLMLDGPNPILCPGTSIDLSEVPIVDLASTNGVMTYHSAFPTTPANQLVNTVVSPSSPTIYYVKKTTAFGCSDVTAFVVNLYSAPQVSIVQGDSVALCRGKSINLQAVPTAPGTLPHEYNWSNGLNFANIPVQASMTPGVTQTYTITLTDANGCSSTDAIKVHSRNNVSQTAIVEINHVDVCGGNDGFIRLNPLDGTPPYQIQWSGPVTGMLSNITGVATLAGLTQGGYRVTISDASGACNLVLPQIVINAPGFEVSVDAIVHPACPGTNTGSIALLVSGLNPVFNWSNNQTGPVANGLSSGVYSVTVTDGNCTQVLSDLEITSPPDIQLVLNDKENVRCFGGADGFIDLAVFGGTPPYIYLWNNGAVTQDLNGLPAGTYNCTVQDTKGCTSTTGPYEVTQPSALVLIVDLLAHVRCFGENNGSIAVNVSGGTPPFQYAWSNGADEPFNASLPPGFYQLTVTDANNCTVVQSATINEPDQLEASSVQLQNPTCLGVANGVLELVVSGGQTPYQYVWNTGLPADTTAILLNRDGGMYSVTVTDNAGCTYVRSNIVLDAPQLLQLTLDVLQPVLCFGENTGAISVSITGGEGQVDVAWNGQTGSTSLQNLPAGTYTIEASDERSCTVRDTFIVAQPLMPLNTQVLSIENVQCAGDAAGKINVQTTGGTTPYQFVWSYDGYSEEDLTDVPAGFYDLLVSDANGCTFLLPTQTIAESPALVVTPSITEIPCFGPQIGSIVLQVQGGVGAYSYFWNTGAQTQAIYNLQAGLYDVTVFDGLGCVRVLSELVVRERKSTLVLETTFVEPVSCNGDNDGRIGVRVLNGVAPYQFIWSSPVGLHANLLTPRDTAKNLQGGLYALTLSDALGCSVSLGPINIGEPPLLSVGASEVFNLTCKGDSSGRIAVTVSGGLPAYSYLWSNGATTAEAEDLPSGIYRVTITDLQGCTAQTPPVTVAEPALALNILVNSVLDDLCGTALGAISLNVGGGMPPLAYLWNNNDTTASVTGLVAGNYQLTVTDQAGCQVLSPFFDIETLSGPMQLQLLQQADVACYGDSTGSLGVLATNGVGPYLYAWSNGSLAPVQNNLPAGNYGLTVVDAFGCFFSQNFVLNQPAEPLQVGWQSDSLTTGWAITLTPTGGTPPYEAQWDAAAGNQTGLTAIGLDNGTYSAMVTDAENCTVLLTGITTGTSAVDEQDFSEVWLLSPNPTHGDAYLVAKHLGHKGLYLNVYDALGRSVMGAIQLPEYTGDMVVLPSASWPAGMYWIQITDVEGRNHRAGKLIRQ